jgi:hypothetical protein
MRNIDRRLAGIEKLMNIGSNAKNLPPIIIKLWDNGEINQFVPERIEDWITYQRTQTGKAGILPPIFIADPYKEYEARNSLPEKATKSNQTQPISGK